MMRAPYWIVVKFTVVGLDFESESRCWLEDNAWLTKLYLPCSKGCVVGRRAHSPKFETLGRKRVWSRRKMDSPAVPQGALVKSTAENIKGRLSQGYVTREDGAERRERSLENLFSWHWLLQIGHLSTTSTNPSTCDLLLNRRHRLLVR